MTVENQIPYQSYIANGEDTFFTLSFFTEDKENLQVVVDTNIVSSTEYTYDNRSNAIVFNNLLKEGSLVEIKRLTTIEREIQYATYNNTFRPETLNYDLDRIIRILQELGYTDSVLLNKISKEIVDRTQAIKQLQDQILLETAKRIAMDASLQKQIDSNDLDIFTIFTEIENEITNRIEGDKEVAKDSRAYTDFMLKMNNSTNIFNGIADNIVMTETGETQKQVNQHIRENGAALPYDSNINYKNGAIALKEGVLSQNNNDIWRPISVIKTVDLSYLKPSFNFDITALLNETLKLSSIAPLKVILPYSISLLINKSIKSPIDSKGVVLDLNGSTLKAVSVSTSNSMGGYLLELMCPSANLVIVENGVLDGSLREQNLFESTEVSDLEKGCNGLAAQAINVIFRNLTLQHIYGQTTKTVCRNFLSENVTVEDCGGHWYTNNGWDAFGDAFYIATGWNDTGIITANFINTTANGKHSDQYVENHRESSPLTQIQYSRIGITIEKFYGPHDNILYLNMDNCHFENYERGFHQELSNITSYLYLKNTTFNSCVLFGAYLTNTMNSYSEFCNFGFYGSGYNGSKGLARGYGGTSIATVNRCVITNLGDEENSQIFGSSSTVNISNSEIKGVSREWCSGSVLTLKSCKIDVIKHSTVSYIAWASTLSFEGVDVTYSGSETSLKNYFEHLNFKKIKNCSFENFLFSLDTLQDNFSNSTIIVPNDDETSFKGTRWKVKTKSGIVKNIPHILWGVSENRFHDQRFYTKVHAKNEILNLLDEKTKELGSKVSLMLVVVKGYSDGINRLNAIHQTGYGQGYYVAVAKYDNTHPNKIKKLTPFYPVGSIDGAGFSISIDDNFNVSNYGTWVTHVHTAFIPYSEIDTLPFIPDGLYPNFNKGVAITKAVGTDDTSIKFNELLASLKTAGYIE